MNDQMRMDAYYYGFEPTGNPAIDKILSAVAHAGKAYHHTEDWNDHCTRETLAGNTPAEWIQNAANEAAEALAKEPVSKEAQEVGMRFCCGTAEKLTLEIADLRNVVQVALNGADVQTINRTWNKYFPKQARTVEEGGNG